METVQRSLTLDGNDYGAVFTGVTDTLDGVTHIAVRFTDPLTDDHFHVRFRVPVDQNPLEYFPQIPEADLEGGLRDALLRAAHKPVR